MNGEHPNTREAPTTDLDLTDGSNRPPTATFIVDLGFGVARVRHEWYWQNLAGEPIRWWRSTTLTIMTPADHTEACAQPAMSAMAFMTEEQLKALIGALS